MRKSNSLLPVNKIQRQIYVVRRTNVMFSADLAALYGVEVKAMNQAVKRNKARFPKDFMPTYVGGV